MGTSARAAWWRARDQGRLPAGRHSTGQPRPCPGAAGEERGCREVACLTRRNAVLTVRRFGATGITDGDHTDTGCRSLVCGTSGGGDAPLLFPRNLRNPTCPSGKVSPMAEGGRPVSPGTSRHRAGERPGGHHATRCPVPQRSAPWAPRPGVHGRRKDCLVTTPEAEPRKEARRAPVRFSAAGGSYGHRPHHRDDRRWLPGRAV